MAIIGGLEQGFRTEKNKSEEIEEKRRKASHAHRIEERGESYEDRLREDGLSEEEIEEIRNTELDPSDLEPLLIQNLRELDEVFNLSDIRALNGAPNPVVEAASGETIDDLETEVIATYWAEGGKNDYAFDAQIDAGNLDVGQEELRFDIDLWGSFGTRWPRYEDLEDARPGLLAVGNTFPEAEFMARLWFEKPPEAIDLYERAIEESKTAVVNQVPLQEGEVTEYEEGLMYNILAGNCEGLFNGLRSGRMNNEAYVDLVNRAHAEVLRDAAHRLSEEGLEVDKQEPFDLDYPFTSYEDMAKALEEGKTDYFSLDLSYEGSDTIIELSSRAEDPYTLPLEGPSDLGYMLFGRGEEGVEVLTKIYEDSINSG